MLAQLEPVSEELREVPRAAVDRPAQVAVVATQVPAGLVAQQERVATWTAGCSGNWAETPVDQ